MTNERGSDHVASTASDGRSSFGLAPRPSGSRWAQVAASGQSPNHTHTSPASSNIRSSTWGPAATRRRSRTAHRRVWRILAAAFLLITLLVIDRVAAVIAADALASRIQSTEALTHKPKVHIGGFPFLTQIITGSYSDVILSGVDIQRQGARISAAQVHLHGVQVSLGDVVNGQVRAVPLKSGSGTAHLTFADVNGLLRLYGGPLVSQLHVSSAGGGQIKISGPLGLSLTVSARVTRGDLLLTPDPNEVTALPGLVGAVIKKAAHFPVPIPRLPFNAKLVSGHTDDNGVTLTLSDAGTVLRTR